MHILLAGSPPLDQPGQTREARRKLLGEAGDARRPCVLDDGLACSPAAREVLNKLLTVDHNARPPCGYALEHVEQWAGAKAASL